MEARQYTIGDHEIAQPGKAMSITIEENPEEAIETFARLSTLGHFAKAATLFEDVLKTYVDELPVFAEYTDFLIQQGKYGALLDRVKERSNMKTAAQPEEDEIVYLELLRILSILHFEGRLLDTLEAIQHRIKSYKILRKSPTELTYIQIRSVKTYIAIITAVISIVPKSAIKYASNVTVTLSPEKTYVFETGASDSSEYSLAERGLSNLAASPWVKFQTWCVLLTREHPLEAVNAFRTLLCVLPADETTSPWVSKFMDSISSHSHGPEFILARVEAMNAWMWVRRGGRRRERYVHDDGDWLSLLPPSFRRLIDGDENSIVGGTEASQATRNAASRLSSLLPHIELPLILFRLVFTLWMPLLHRFLLLLDSDILSSSSEALRDERRLGNPIATGRAPMYVEGPPMTAKTGFEFLDELYEVGFDSRSQQVIELELNAIAATGKCHRLKAGLEGLANIAREEANYRLESLCLQLMIELSGEKAPVSATHPLLSSRALYTRTVQDAIELVNLLDNLPTNDTTLQASASIGSLAAVRLTIDRGDKASLTYEQRREGQTSEPIHQAARKGYEQIAQIFQDHDETISSKADANGYLPLHVAAENGHDALIPLLLGSQQEHIDRQVEIISQGALSSRASFFTRRQRDSKSPSAENQERGTALHLASANGHEKVVASLLHCKAMIDEKDDQGWTALHKASARWQYGAANILLRHGADVTLKTSSGMTAVELAVRSGYTELVALLLQYQSASDFEGNCGSAIVLAVKNRDLETASLLGRHTKAMQVVIKSHQLKEALHFAVGNEDLYIVKLLLECGADGTSVLQKSLAGRNADILELLLERGADIEAKDNTGKTVLHRAIEVRHRELVRILVARGANIEAKDYAGKTVLDSTMEGRDEDIVQMLVARGAGVGTDLRYARYARELQRRTGLTAEEGSTHGEASAGSPEA